MRLLDKTRELLRLANLPPKERKELARSIGVTPIWLKDFENGEYQDPGVNKVQKLYEELTGERLL